jgi:predicted ATPase
VLGPGGIGKSRCARAVARQARDGGIWNDGVWYVDLTTLPDADGSGIAAAVATVIGAGHQATVPSAADIGTYLEGRDVLVVLDNCEHVRAAVVAFLNAMFDNCSTAAVLATSRVRLGLAGERLIELPTLSGSEAVALFTARTAELGTGPFPAEDVEQLCVSLDNYPLALELAAARTRTHTPSEIVTRLDRHPSLAQHQVTTGTAPGQPAARHDSLDAALAWSLDQLDSSALATLQRSTVFADGFDLAAAEAVLPTATASQFVFSTISASWSSITSSHEINHPHDSHSWSRSARPYWRVPRRSSGHGAGTPSTSSTQRPTSATAFSAATRRGPGTSSAPSERISARRCGGRANTATSTRSRRRCNGCRSWSSTAASSARAHGRTMR